MSPEPNDQPPVTGPLLMLVHCWPLDQIDL